MASKNKTKDDPPAKNGKSNGNRGAKPPEMESLNSVEAVGPAEPKTANSCQPTRNCGCNTLISGKFNENSGKSEESPTKNSCSPVAACSCGCCHRPRYTYCYNPCTGYYYWYQKSCCCGYNGCCNNGGSCPIPKRSSNSGTASPSKGQQIVKQKGPVDTAKVKSPANPVKVKGPADPAKVHGPAADDRFLAGAMTAFQPGVQDLYDQWVGFQQHGVFPPMVPPRQQPPFVSSGPTYYRSTRFYSSPFQMDTRFSSQSQDRDEPEYRSPDIDWTPQ